MVGGCFRVGAQRGCASCLRLGQGVAEPPVCDWGMACPPRSRKRKAEERYCHPCGETHSHTLWHYLEDYVFCHRAYTRAYRTVQPGEPCHPSWVPFLEGLRSSDRSGHLICSQAWPDAQALMTMNALLREHPLWSRTQHRKNAWADIIPRPQISLMLKWTPPPPAAHILKMCRYSGNACDQVCLTCFP